jgi:restriction system protein
MFENGVSSKFEILLASLGNIITELNQEGARQFSKADHRNARLFLEKAEAATQLLKKLKELQEEWHVLESRITRDGPKGEKSPELRQSRQDFLDGYTPQEKFRFPILRALVDLGGSANTEVVRKEVEKLMASVLTESDKRPLPSTPGIPAWHKSTKNARRMLVDQGMMAPFTKVGLWEITDAGRQALLSGKPLGRPGKKPEPLAPDADPNALPYVFMVVQQVKKGATYGGALKQIRKENDLKSGQTVSDACTWKINLSSSEFVELLRDIPRLVDYLSSLFPEHEKLIRETIST